MLATSSRRVPGGTESQRRTRHDPTCNKSDQTHRASHLCVLCVQLGRSLSSRITSSHTDVHRSRHVRHARCAQHIRIGFAYLATVFDRPPRRGGGACAVAHAVLLLGFVSAPQ